MALLSLYKYIKMVDILRIYDIIYTLYIYLINMTWFSEYLPLIKLILFPALAVAGGFVLERVFKTIVNLIRRLEDLIIAFNRFSVILLAAYFIVLAYLKLS